METTQIDIKTTFDAWFDVTVKVLRKKMALLNIRKTGALYDSLGWLSNEGDKDTIKGTLEYNIYGKFVDMGVGGEMSKGNAGNVKTTRKRKEWYSKLFYSQVMRLREIYQQKYGKEVATGLVNMIEASNDLKYSSYGDKDRARNMKNYRKQIFMPIEQRTWRKTK